MRKQLVVMKLRQILDLSRLLTLTLVALALLGVRAAAGPNYKIAQLRSGSLDNEWRDINDNGNAAVKSAQSPSAYIFTTIEFPGAISTEAHGINNSDQIVGHFYVIFGNFSFIGFLASPTGTGKGLGGSPHPGCPSCGEPISVGSGNIFETVTDYETAGKNKLALQRYYNSFAAASTRAASLGSNWRSNYDRYLNISSSTVTAERTDGQQLIFTLNGGVWASDVVFHRY